MGLEAVDRHLRKRLASRGSPAPFAVTGAGPPSADPLLEWALAFLEDDVQWRKHINLDQPIRGDLPITFAAPEEDRPDAATSVRRLVELVGLLERSAPLAHQVALSFGLADVGPGHVPSALDAFTHRYFEPVAADAEWGRTRDLAPDDERTNGGRECVVREFPARLVQAWKVYDANPAS